MPSSDETFDNIVPQWHRICPDEHRGFILHVAVLFGIRITRKFNPLLLGAPPIEKTKMHLSALRFRVHCRATNRSIDCGFEVVELDRFDEVLREAGLQTSFDITVVAK